eukprot:535182_1
MNTIIKLLALYICIFKFSLALDTIHDVSNPIQIFNLNQASNIHTKQELFYFLDTLRLQTQNNAKNIQTIASQITNINQQFTSLSTQLQHVQQQLNMQKLQNEFDSLRFEKIQTTLGATNNQLQTLDKSTANPTQQAINNINSDIPFSGSVDFNILPKTPSNSIDSQVSNVDQSVDIKQDKTFTDILNQLQTLDKSTANPTQQAINNINSDIPFSGFVDFNILPKTPSNSIDSQVSNVDQSVDIKQDKTFTDILNQLNLAVVENEQPEQIPNNMLMMNVEDTNNSKDKISDINTQDDEFQELMQLLQNNGNEQNTDPPEDDISKEQLQQIISLLEQQDNNKPVNSQLQQSNDNLSNINTVNAFSTNNMNKDQDVDDFMNQFNKFLDTQSNT